MKNYKILSEGLATYRKELYYVNWDYFGSGREIVVPVWKFYLYWLVNFWRAEKYKNFNVLKIRMYKYNKKTGLKI